MFQFTIRRFLRGLLTLWLVVTAIFFALRLSGDPVFLMLGPEASPQAIGAVRNNLGLNDPVTVQYARYVKSIASGNFGESIRERRPATQSVLERLPATAELAAASLLLAILIGIPAGILAALHRDSLLDRALMSLAFIGQSAPNFFLGILLILCFSLWLRLLPSSGRGGWQHLLMPAITLSTYGIASLARLTRSSMLEVLGHDFVRVARAKGLSELRVQTRHVLRNAAIPVLTIFGIQLATAISGAVVTETVFAWPGIGRLATNAVFNRDYPVIQFTALLIAASVVSVNFLVDILYGLIDPRIRDSA
ncbi:MAG: ABC transporter permease [Nitrolancea sp.]